MSKKILAISLLAVASLFVSCGSNDSNAQANTQVVAPKPKPILDKIPFTAPAKSTITVEKANFYAKASNGLVELAVKWSERIERLKMQKSSRFSMRTMWHATSFAFAQDSRAVLMNTTGLRMSP